MSLQKFGEFRIKNKNFEFLLRFKFTLTGGAGRCYLCGDFDGDETFLYDV